jgi:hypothetical protein
MLTLYLLGSKEYIVEKQKYEYGPKQMDIMIVDYPYELIR